MRLLLVIAVLLVISTAGCIGVEEFEADEPSVNQETLDETSYEKTGNNTFEIEESRDILGEERGAIIVSHTAMYEKSADELELNLTEEEIDQQLENIDTEQLLESQSEDAVEVIGEDTLIQRIAGEDDRFTEDQINSLLDSTGQSVSDFVDNNDINVTQYVDKEDVINSIGEDRIEEIIKASSYNETGSIYVVISTPSAGVLGTELNPLVLASSEELLNQVESRTEQNIEFGEMESEETINSTQGHTIKIEQYPATVKTGDGVKVDSKVLLARDSSYERSVLVSVGAYPEFADERSDVIEMIKNTDVDK